MAQPYSTTAQVLNQAIGTLAATAGWNVSEPGRKVVQDLTYTALAVGQTPVSVTYVPGGTAGAEVVTVSGSAITVRIATGVSTATQVLAALTASVAASALVYAAISGNAGAAQVSTATPEVITGDVVIRINESDSEIDMRLAGMGYVLPFATNPTALQQLSVLYARYACFRDLYAAGDPTNKGETAKTYLDRFEEKLKSIESGFSNLVDVEGDVVAKDKYMTVTAPYPQSEGGGSGWPSDGPPPDPPSIGY